VKSRSGFRARGASHFHRQPQEMKKKKVRSFRKEKRRIRREGKGGTRRLGSDFLGKRPNPDPCLDTEAERTCEPLDPSQISVPPSTNGGGDSGEKPKNNWEGILKGFDANIQVSGKQEGKAVLAPLKKNVKDGRLEERDVLRSQQEGRIPSVSLGSKGVRCTRRCCSSSTEYKRRNPIHQTGKKGANAGDDVIRKGHRQERLSYKYSSRKKMKASKLLKKNQNWDRVLKPKSCDLLLLWGFEGKTTELFCLNGVSAND